MTTTVPIDDDHPDFDHLTPSATAAITAADERLTDQIRVLLGLAELTIDMGYYELAEVAIADTQPLIEARRELRDLAVTR